MSIALRDSVLLYQQAILDAYGTETMTGLENFQGGYINFGYWKEIPYQKGKLSKQQRIESSYELYRQAILKLKMTPRETVLEIGSGMGFGCAELARQYPRSYITGLDITPEQTERSKALHKNLMNDHRQLSFITSPAECMPFDDESFTRILSVEMLQHVFHIEAFANEMRRVLACGGRAVVAAHLSTSENALNQMIYHDLLVKENIDILLPITRVISAFEKHFSYVKCESIGAYVFQAYEDWLDQIYCVTPWSHNIYQAYKSEYIDYFMIELA